MGGRGEAKLAKNEHTKSEKKSSEMTQAAKSFRESFRQKLLKFADFRSFNKNSPDV